MGDLAVLGVRVSGIGYTPSEVAAMSRQLQSELLGLAVNEVSPAVAGSLPDGAKALELVAVGALVVSMAPELVTPVVDVLASWLRRQPAEIEVEIDGQRLRGVVTRRQREALVSAYLEKVASGTPQP
ncbi:hypothetical protein ACWER9_07450 [Micromonospora sp. NPDC003944]